MKNKKLIQNYEQLGSIKPSNYTLPEKPSFFSNIKENLSLILEGGYFFVLIGCFCWIGYLTFLYTKVINQNQSLCEVAYKNKIEVSEVPSCFAYYEKKGF